MVWCSARIVSPALVVILTAMQSWAASDVPASPTQPPSKATSAHIVKPKTVTPAKIKPAHPSVKPNAAIPKPADTPKPGDTKQPEAKAGESKPGETKAAAHFASLRAEKVFLRSGPSTDYPVQWVFVRKGLPVEVLASFDIWRKVRDSDGTEGWVHQGMLTGRRSVLIAGVIRDLHHDPNPQSAIVAQLEPGVVAGVSKCDAVWCEVRAGGYRGWVRHDEIWGLEPDEVIQ